MIGELRSIYNEKNPKHPQPNQDPSDNLTHISKEWHDYIARFGLGGLTHF